MKLTIELVPTSCWNSNVRSIVTASQWNVIRKKCYTLANNKCEICGGVGKLHPVECHEIWEYNDETHTQTLKGLIALCPTCHMVKHAGLAEMQGKINVVIRQLMKVNGTDMDNTVLYINKSFAKWHERSKFSWSLNINFLNNY